MLASTHALPARHRLLARPLRLAELERHALRGPAPCRAHLSLGRVVLLRRGLHCRRLGAMLGLPSLPESSGGKARVELGARSIPLAFCQYVLQAKGASIALVTVQSRAGYWQALTFRRCLTAFSHGPTFVARLNSSAAPSAGQRPAARISASASSYFSSQVFRAPAARLASQACWNPAAGNRAWNSAHAASHSAFRRMVCRQRGRQSHSRRCRAKPGAGEHSLHVGAPPPSRAAQPPSPYL